MGTRPGNAGKFMAQAIIETCHILYLNDNALQYLIDLDREIRREIRRRKHNEEVMRKEREHG